MPHFFFNKLQQFWCQRVPLASLATWFVQSFILMRLNNTWDRSYRSVKKTTSSLRPPLAHISFPPSSTKGFRCRRGRISHGWRRPANSSLPYWPHLGQGSIHPGPQWQQKISQEPRQQTRVWFIEELLDQISFLLFIWMKGSRHWSRLP